MSQPPAIPSSTVSRSAVICWVVIVASIGYVAGRVFWQKSMDDAATAQSSGSMDLELSARVLVGKQAGIGRSRGLAPPPRVAPETTPQSAPAAAAEVAGFRIA